MREDEVVMVTTESVPGDDRVIVQSLVLWHAADENIAVALNNLRKRAAENGWDAVVGIRFLVNQTISPVNSSALSTVSSASWYMVYGTAIRYQRRASSIL
jgi:uncharacterized protein YbjQ (UPF0145 family)